MQFDLTTTQKHIVRTIESLGKTTWVVGGAVRDLIRGIEPKDIDFATNCCHLTLEKVLIGAGYVVIPDATAKQHGIIRVVDKTTGELIDIARLRKDVHTDGRHAVVEFTDILEEDLARRDFTINAMAVQINDEGEEINFVDPFYGKEALKNYLITFVGNAEKRIQEDYLRMVRACRFTALGTLWRISVVDNPSINEYAEKIQLISKERIRDEILKALMYPIPSNFFRNLDACGLLPFIMPAMADTIGVTQNKHHEFDTVFDHLMRAVDASVEFTDNLMLRLSVLLHDIGKPPTRSVDKDGGVHFYSHEIAGASIAYNWMKEYKFSREQLEYVSLMIRQHQWRFTNESRDKTIKKWLEKVGKHRWRDLITLRMCDRKGNKAKQHRPTITRKMKELMQTVQRILDYKEPTSQKDLAINGHDLISMGYKPGKLFKEIFDGLVELILDDPTNNTKEILLEHVRTHYGQQKDQQYPTGTGSN